MNIKYRSDQKFSLTAYQVHRPFKVTPSSVNVQSFISGTSTNISKTISIAQGYTDTQFIQRQIRIEVSDSWIVPQGEFLNTTTVNINNRAIVLLPLLIETSAMGYGLRTGSIRITINNSTQFIGSAKTNQPPLEEITIPINVLVLSNNDVYAPNISISHFQGSSLPTVDYNVMANGIFNLQIPNALKVVSDHITNEVVTTDYTIYSLNSTDNLKLKLIDESIGLFDYPIHLYNNANDSSATCHVNVEEEMGYQAIPNEVSFKAIKDYEEAEPVKVDLQGVGNFTIESPSWLNIDKTSGSHSTSIELTPWNSVNFGPSVLRGSVNIIMQGVLNTRIPVTYTIIKGIDLNLRVWRLVNFIADNKITTLYAPNLAKSVIDIRAFDDGRMIGNVVEKAHFKNKSTFHIGQHVKHLIPRPKVNLQADEYFYRNLFVTDITAMSIDADEETINYEEFYNTAFWKGHTPVQFNDEVGVLKRKNLLQRVYNNSYIILNLMSVKDNVFIEVFKNDTLIEHKSINSSTDVFGFKSMITGTPGDIISYRVKYGHPADGLFYESSYVVFPGPLPNYKISHLLFINEYDTLESFATAGVSILEVEGVSIDVDRTLDFKREILRLDNKMNHKLKINTGHCLMQDKNLVYRLMNAKQVWLHTESGDYIPIIPNEYQESIVSDAELYEADLEFKINTDDIQNYSF
ncbi:MAG TPA: hypothetical protein VK050_06510 [Flavobacteriaceae bacterium]|nr:hypothetical protein [Flavobacteriaceae bacterium]